MTKKRREREPAPPPLQHQLCLHSPAWCWLPQTGCELLRPAVCLGNTACQQLGSPPSPPLNPITPASSPPGRLSSGPAGSSRPDRPPQAPAHLAGGGRRLGSRCACPGAAPTTSWHPHRGIITCSLVCPHTHTPAPCTFLHCTTAGEAGRRLCLPSKSLTGAQGRW